MEENEECSICLQNILPEQRCVTNCDHVFCESCIDAMLNIGKTTCPMCRSPLHELCLRDKILRIVRVRDPTISQAQPIYINVRLRRLVIFGLSVLGMGMFYFAYYVWDTYETNKETKIELKICEEMLEHSTNTVLDD